MQHNGVTGALAYLVARPARPRYQDRTMDAAFIGRDDDCARIMNERCNQAAERFAAAGAELAQCRSGSVHLGRGPIVVAGLALLALGAATLIH